MPNVAFGIRREGQASDRPQRGRGRPASCRGAFEGGPKCLTSPSEAHKKRGGRLYKPQRSRGRPASCRGAFEGGPKCLGGRLGQGTERPQLACPLPRRV